MKHTFDFGSRFRILKGGKISMVVSALVAGSTMSFAAPSGGVVSAGSATIAQNGSVTTINQNTQRASINWQSFGIGASESVNFNQPNSSAVALNRVVGNESSVINGALNANGKVWILNSNGVLFGKNASVNTAGLVASTMNITDQNFVNGNYAFESTGSSASVINMGTIRTTDGGYVALLGKNVSNSGLIEATKGAVVLAAGDKISLNFNGDSLVSIAIDKGTLDALVENKGAIIADGGRIFLTTKAADSLLNGVVNNTGLLQAQTLDDITGYIEVYAHGGTANIAGTVKAEGGFVETSGEKVKISDDFRVSAKDWLIDPTDFTIAASGGNISGDTLSTALGAGNVSILSSNGTTTGNGDINVNDAVSWSANSLTLIAARDININAVMTASGASTLILNPATANGGDGAVVGGTVKVGFNPDGTFKGRIDFPGRSGAGILSINGADYTIINSLGLEGSTTRADLQGMNGNLSGKYVLGANIAAGATSGWDGNKGFNPVGTLTGAWSADGTNVNGAFTGVFDGLGHTITGLAINRTIEYQGLFGNIAVGSAVRNVGMDGGSINGSVAGMLAGINNGSAIINSYATGNVSGHHNTGGLVGMGYNATIINSHATGTVSGTIQAGSGIGGLIGQVGGGGTITNSYATGAVSGVGIIGGLVGATVGVTITNSYATGNAAGSANHIGGLVGLATGGAVTNSHATGTATGSGGGSTYVGGLVGEAAELTGAGVIITNSYATGAASGVNIIGGLVGKTTGGEVTNSYATGNANGSNDQVGGLVGLSSNSAIAGSHATGIATAGQNQAGGLVGGVLNGTVANSYATGVVNGGNIQTGGLVGFNNAGAISNSYATGAVTGTSNDVGGLVGGNTGTITNSRATGTVTGNGTDTVGGLIGSNSGAVSYAYATGTVTGATVDRIGGLIGFNGAAGSIHDAYANGSVTGVNAGGLVGANSGSVTNAYATGAVSGSTSAGGLVGNNAGTITKTYSTGAVSGTGSKGGLAGLNTGTVNNSFWDAQTSGQSTSAGGTSKTTTEMKTIGTFTDAGWDMVATTSQTYTGHPYGGLSMDGATNVWMLSPPAAPAPAAPTPSVNNDAVTPTLTPAAPQPQLAHNNIVLSNVVTTSVNPVVPQPPRMDAKVSSNTGIVVKSDMAPVISKGFTEGAMVDLISKPLSGEPTQSLSLSDVKAMQQSKGSADGSSGQEIRVAVSHENTIISLVNGGVKLPSGIEQEFYVVNIENKAAK